MNKRLISSIKKINSIFVLAADTFLFVLSHFGRAAPKGEGEQSLEASKFSSLGKTQRAFE
jgi:hypothetical protein